MLNHGAELTNSACVYYVLTMNKKVSEGSLVSAGEGESRKCVLQKTLLEAPKMKIPKAFYLKWRIWVYI